MRRNLAISLIGGVLLTGAPVQAAELAGRLKTVAGAATITSSGSTQTAAVDQPVHMGDVIETGKDGSVGITFRDASRFSVGPNSKVVIDEYVFSPRDGESSFVTRVQRGTLFYVSGLIAKMTPERTAVKTPDGTIGIRGTRFVVEVSGS